VNVVASLHCLPLSPNRLGNVDISSFIRNITGHIADIIPVVTILATLYSIVRSVTQEPTFCSHLSRSRAQPDADISLPRILSRSCASDGSAASLIIEVYSGAHSLSTVSSKLMVRFVAYASP